MSVKIKRVKIKRTKDGLVETSDVRNDHNDTVDEVIRDHRPRQEGRKTATIDKPEASGLN